MSVCPYPAAAPALDRTADGGAGPIFAWFNMNSWFRRLLNESLLLTRPAAPGTRSSSMQPVTSNSSAVFYGAREGRRLLRSLSAAHAALFHH